MMLRKKCCVDVVLLLGWIVGNASTAALAGDVMVGAKVPKSAQVPLSRIDHASWDGLLRKYVNDRGMVDYTHWKNSVTDTQALEQYLQQLSGSNGQGSREQKLAFWINAYNSLTIHGILREYPTTSIRNHTAKLFGYNIWKNLKLIVGEQPISLDDIEHQVLRKMSEPRIHFAIVCASIGCPRLLNAAYTPDDLDQQLTANARAFFADRARFRYDAKRNVFYVSPILHWFSEDFGSSESAQLKRIAPWIPDETASKAATHGSGRLSFVDYDWGLNDHKTD